MRTRTLFILPVMTLILAAAFIICPNFSYGAESGREVITYSENASGQVSDSGAGDIGVHIKLSDDEDTASDSESNALSRASLGAPSDKKYDPRNEEWFESVTVKNQGSTGLCWAFAATTAAEISYAKAGGTSGVLLSPVHLGYFFYNRVNDPLGNTKGDYNKLKKDSASGITDYTDVGGNNLLTFQALAGWTGAAAEETAPFSEPLPDTLNSSLAYRNRLVLKNADILGSNEAVKKAITENGSAAVSLYMNQNASYYNARTNAYYCSNDKIDSNHVVVIVGWDDTYSRINFNLANRPEGDGAWIVQNSYGSSWGDGGYFYVSYEDATLENALTLQMQEADTYDYNYQYDGNAAYGMFELQQGEKAANVFTVPRDGKAHFLDAVGFTSFLTNSDDPDAEGQYGVTVYTNLKNSASPTSGTKKCSFSVSVGANGFHTVSLDGRCERIYLEPGSSYSVVVTMKEKAYIGAEYSEKGIDWIRFYCGLAKGQSFWYDSESKSWKDAYSSSFCARIKGFTNTETAMTSKPSSAKISLYGHDDVKFSWSKVTGADGYRVTYKKSSGSWQNAVTLKYTSGTSVKKANLTDGVKYNFRVEPYKIKDGIRYYSSGYRTCSIYTLKKSAVKGISKASSKYIRVKWKNISGETGYQIARSAHKSSGYSIVKTAGSKYSSAKIKTKKNKTYYYKVRAYRTENGKKIYGPWSSAQKYRLK